jgi:beta-glucosidase
MVQALARKMAEEGITLLKNDRQTLPLHALGKTVKRVAVIGPNADNTHSMLGSYGNTNPVGGTVTVRATCAP